jgi:hypothetical protein
LYSPADFAALFYLDENQSSKWPMCRNAAESAETPSFSSVGFYGTSLDRQAEKVNLY